MASHRAEDRLDVDVTRPVEQRFDSPESSQPGLPLVGVVGKPPLIASADPPVTQQRLDELWDFSDPAGSEARFSAAFNEASSGGGAAAEYATQQARALGLQERFAEAESLLARVEPADGVAAIRVALERGRLRNSSGDAAAAVPLFRAAAELAGEAGQEFLAVDAYHMLALADPGRAEEWTGHGLRVVADSNDARTRRWAGSLHNNFGWHLHDSGEFVAALRQFEQALQVYSENGTPDQVHAARWAVARALRSLERFDEAADMQIDLAEADPTDPDVQEELAELKAALGRPDRAEEHRRRAAELRQAE